jgi:hypothetical protein
MMHSPFITEKRMTTTVEHEADPKRPGRTAYRITSHCRAEVQAEIDRLTDTVDAAFGGAPGMAQFTHPVQLGDRTWRSLGHVVVMEAA